MKGSGRQGGDARTNSVSDSEQRTLRKLEKMRIKALAVRVLTVAIISVAAIAYTVVCGYIILQEGATTRELRLLMAACGAIVLMAVVPLGMLARSVLRHYAAEYKETLVRGVLAEVFPQGCDYRPDSGFSQTYLNRLPLLKEANDLHSEDYISATYDGVNFRQADVMIAGILGRNRTVFFEGRLFEFSLGKPGEGKLLIVTEYFPYRDSPEKYGMQSVKLPEELAARYEAFADDQARVNEVLTTEVMLRIDRVAGHFSGVAIYIEDDKLYLAARTWAGNSFEPSIKKKLHLSAEKTRIRSELEVIERLTDELLLGRDEPSGEDDSAPSETSYIEQPKREPIRPGM